MDALRYLADSLVSSRSEPHPEMNTFRCLTFSSLLLLVAGSSRHYDVCITPECLEAAASVAASMNVSVDPCEDFFEYTCGGWVSRHPVPKTESHWNQFNVVDEKLQYKIRDILEAEIDSSDLEPIKAAKTYYKSCMDVVSIEEGGVGPLKELLDSLGGWPMAQKHWKPIGRWDTTMGMMTRLLALSPLVTVYVFSDRKDSTKHVITIDQPVLGLPRSMLVERQTYSSQIDAYMKWIFTSARLLSDLRIPDRFILPQVQDLVDFEIQVAKLTSPNEMRRNGFRTYNAMTLRELQTWTDTSSMNQINWLDMLRVLFNNDTAVEWDERVVVKEVDYLYKLAKLLETTSPRVIANYLVWRVVKTYGRDLNEKMRKLGFAFDQVLTGATQDQPRWKECVYSTSNSLSMAVGYSYVRRHFDEEARKIAMEMASNIKWVFSEEMSKVDWMDEQTIKAARFKVDSMTELIGYPHWFNDSANLVSYYKDLAVGRNHFKNVIASREFLVKKMFSKLKEQVDRKEWPMTPAVVNAFYSQQTNSIIFPAGVLQSPFFSKGRIEALNYGAIGVVIGHEITHGFDDVGRQSDWLGNLVQWWSEATIETYIKKTQCFVDQYSSFRVPQLDSTLLTQVTVNGVTTLGENIADNGGLRAALLAYRRHVEKNGPEPRLPGLEYLSPEQLFFIAFATNWCESNTKESLLHEILTDAHSPHRVRVLGTVHNSPDFPKIFNCPTPEPPTCKIW